jgi:hypothetical protein
MSGGKKFNVWVVYADLFSNLSTFLFISAFGMFAALGSGALRMPTGIVPNPPAVGTACSAKTPGLDNALTDKPANYTSKFAPIAGQGLSQAKCAHYFIIKDYWFAQGQTDVVAFSPSGNIRKKFNDATLYRVLCQPVWGAALEAGNNWQVTLLGLASARSSSACRTKRSTGPKMTSIVQVAISDNRSIEMSADDIAACRAGIRSKGCHAALRCLNPGDSAYTENWCGAVRDAKSDPDKQCQINVGRLRAQNFAQYCRQAVEWQHFDTKVIAKAGEENVPVNLESKWMDRVHIDGAAISPGANVGDVRDGSVVVEIQPRGG